jgi:hypothetical protein
LTLGRLCPSDPPGCLSAPLAAMYGPGHCQVCTWVGVGLGGGELAWLCCVQDMGYTPNPRGVVGYVRVVGPCL